MPGVATWRTKGEYVKHWVVSFIDFGGIPHSAEVQAESMY
jgi:hypothetical protein